MSDAMSHSHTDSSPKETYSLDNQHHRQFMEHRTASIQASFFIPHLRSGMKLLDCGCGAGAITVGLAEVVAPGEVIGIDRDPQQIDLARQRVVEQGISNLRFEPADVYALPFPDNSFDAVFANALFEHLAEPVAALLEFKRVVKPGGVIGVRCGADGNLIAPPEPLLLLNNELFRKLFTHNGGDYTRGIYLRALFREASLSHIEASASYEIFATLERTRKMADMLIHLMEGRMGRQAIELGLIDEETLSQIIAAWKNWGGNPDAFLARSWGQAVGWNE